MTYNFPDLNSATKHFARQLIDSSSIQTTNPKNAERYKNELGGELSQLFFRIEDPRRIVGTFENHKPYEWWMHGEILSEMLNLDPPLMYKYRPDLFSQHYDLLEDGTMQYTYASRWSEFHQLLNTYNKLKQNPNSKRAVIAIYTPYDTSPDRADAPCFPGDTEILSPEGDITIKELFRKYTKNEKYPVYTMNETSKQIQIKFVKRVFKKKQQQLVRVHFDDDSFIDTTADHEFYIKKSSGQEYVKSKVKDLKPNDRIVPFTMLVQKKGLKYIKNLKSNWSWKNQVSVQHEYFEFLHGRKTKKDFDIHHMNHDPHCNQKSNLQEIHHFAHSSITQKLNNRMIDPEQRRSQSLKLKNNPKLKIKFTRRILDDSLTNNQWKDKFLSAGRILYEQNQTFNKSLWLAKKHTVDCPKTLGGIKHINLLFGNFFEFNLLVRNNHKITRIEFLKKSKVMYDIEMDENHNYFVKFNNLNKKKYRELNSNDNFHIQLGCLVSNCTLGYQFLHRDGKLNMTVSFRSHDFFGGFKTYDFALASFIQQSFCSWLDMEPGTLGVYENSLHYYNRDREKLEHLVAETKSSNRSSDRLFVDAHLGIKDFYTDLRKVKSCEEAAYNKNLEDAERFRDEVRPELFKRMCDVYMKKNLKMTK